MEQVLRKKFIRITVTVVFIVLLTIALVTNVSTFLEIDGRANNILTILGENNGRFMNNQGGGQNPPMDHLSQETPYSTRYFTVKLAESGKLISVDTRSINAVSSEDAVAYATAVLEEDTLFSYYNYFKYAIVEQEEAVMVIFVDCTQELTLLRAGVVSSVVICFVELLAVFLLVLAASKKAVAPIVESHQKQQQFITNISHELKTPLAIIKTNTEVVEVEHGDSQWTKSIHNQINRLNGLVNYMVSLSKLDEDGREQVEVDFSLSDAVEEMVQSFEVLAQSNQRVLSCQLSPNLSYHGDEQSIRLLLSILLENAIKYSNDSCPIQITLEPKGERCRLTVKNGADHLKVDNYDMLFERFYRMDTSRNSSTGGYGIGLAIAKTIVRNHRGKIQAESKDGETLQIQVIL